MRYGATSYTYHPIKQRPIVTQCPLCGQRNVLEIWFYQKEIDSDGTTAMTKEVSAILYCKHHHAELHPVQWPDAAVQEFELVKPRLDLMPSTNNIKKKFIKRFLMIFIPFLLLIAGAYMWFFHLDPNDTLGIQEPYASADPGDILKVKLNTLQDGGYVESMNYFQVKQIVADTVWIQEYGIPAELADSNNLRTTDFKGQVYKVRYDSFRIGFLTAWNDSNGNIAGFTEKLIEYDK